MYVSVQFFRIDRSDTDQRYTDEFSVGTFMSTNV